MTGRFTPRMASPRSTHRCPRAQCLERATVSAVYRMPIVRRESVAGAANARNPPRRGCSRRGWGGVSFAVPHHRTAALTTARRTRPITMSMMDALYPVMSPALWLASGPRRNPRSWPGCAFCMTATRRRPGNPGEKSMARRGSPCRAVRATPPPTWSCVRRRRGSAWRWRVTG